MTMRLSKDYDKHHAVRSREFENRTDVSFVWQLSGVRIRLNVQIVMLSEAKHLTDQDDALFDSSLRSKNDKKTRFIFSRSELDL